MKLRLAAVILAASAFAASAEGINYDALGQIHNDPNKPFATLYYGKARGGEANFELYENAVARPFCSGKEALLVERGRGSMKIVGHACWKPIGYDNDGMVIRVDLMMDNSSEHRFGEFKQTEFKLANGAFWPTM
ncbi:hypothetical protein BHU60_23225 [Klebsiella pneumoniae]|uniref:hypothetical protein n=1 Tax=Klebsiella pneumoniae TaxID=573 RepID=UPI00085985E2|nr:hypothetical protein [Klebsiella pneumoniae]OEJ71779.1 hypothetical protein BHU60_23225 [Klebsiella pneumoniae]